MCIFLYFSQYSQVIYHKKALILRNLTICIISLCDNDRSNDVKFIHFSQTLFLSFSYSYYCFSQPQTATNSILYFRLGSLLSKETIFTFLHASNAEKSSCDPDALQSRMMQFFFSQTIDLQTISALVQALLCLTNLCFLEATIGRIRIDVILLSVSQ